METTNLCGNLMLILCQWIVRRTGRRVKNTTNIATSFREIEVGIGVE
jgi:hypothetical protein